jgi:hypothetical protein
MSPQQPIAHYRITAKLGQGGMGEVWRATDTKLNREVAIKIRPSGFAEDAGRMQRFEREAQVLASLNHPNIAAIYSIEQGAIVIELVPGEDAKCPVPVETHWTMAGRSRPPDNEYGYCSPSPPVRTSEEVGRDYRHAPRFAVLPHAGVIEALRFIDHVERPWENCCC